MSFNTKFVTYEQIILLHEGQIEEFGGHHGVKDEGLVRSAIAQPQSGFGEDYFHKDIYEMAAAYLFHLVKNHAFHDGNKRIAALAASVFLQVNGFQVIADEEEFEKIVLDAAQSLIGKTEIADFFRKTTTSY
jgi:death on curing protein